MYFQESKQDSLLGDKNKSYYKTDIQFERDVIYGSTEQVILGRVAAVAVDDSSRVYIADADQTTIHVFNPGGRYRTALGREGKGPGEFTGMSEQSTFMRIRSNRLYVPDFMDEDVSLPNRLHIFSLDNHSFSHTLKLFAENQSDYEELKGYYPKQMYPLADGRFLVAYHRLAHDYRDSKSVIQYVLQNSDGEIVSKSIPEQRDIRYLAKKKSVFTALIRFPFFEKSLLAVSDSDQLYIVKNTRKFHIDVYEERGNLNRSFNHPFDNKRFEKSRVLNWYQQKGHESHGTVLSIIRQADDLPETWPALEGMFFDDEDRLWVSTIIDDLEVYEWWILKKSGELITKFTWPRDKPIQTVQNGYLYTLETDADGLQHVVRYRIQIN